MSNFDPARNVYQVKEVTFSANGTKYPVSGVRLSCVDNGIPTATITLSPFSDDTTKADLSSMITKYNELNGLSGGRKGSVDVSVKLHSESDDQEIKLSGWPLLYAGLRNMSADGSFQVYVVAQHPVVKANLSAMCLQNLYNNSAGLSPTLYGADNTLKAITSAIYDYLAARDPKGETVSPDGENVDYSGDITPTMRVIDADAHANAVAALTEAENQLDWAVEGSSFPCQGQIGEIATHVKDHLRYTVSAQGQSILETVRGLLGEFMLCIKAGFDSEKIKVKAFEPWAKPSLTIYDDQTSSSDIPPVSDAVVSGIVVIGPTIRATDATTYTADQPDPASDDKGEYGRIEQGSIGGYTEVAKALGGDIRQVALPGWLSIYYESRLTGKDAYTRQGLNGDPELPMDPDSLGDYDKTREAMKPAVGAYAHDMFWQLFRSSVGISLSTRYMLSAAEGPLLPGVCASLTAREGGELFQFYITSVEHSLDAMSGEASSRIEGAYLRGKAASGGGAEAAVSNIADGIKSKMWSK